MNAILQKLGLTPEAISRHVIIPPRRDDLRHGGMKITTTFKHTDADFSGSVSDGRGILFGYIHWRKKRPKSPPGPEKGNRARVKDEWFQWFYRSVLQPPPKAGFTSTAEFENWFFECVRNYMLDEASRFGRLCVPANYPEQFWKQDFLKRLMKRLSKKPSSRQILRTNTEVLLIRSWTRDKLNKMTAEELSDWCGQFFQGQITKTYSPKQLFEIATGVLGLVTFRKAGPKGFGE